jgi:type I restriction enzyme S subunit
MKSSFFFNFKDVVSDVTSGFKKINKSEYSEEGETPIIDQSKKQICGYTNLKPKVNLLKPPYIIFGDHTRCFKYSTKDFILGADGTKVLKAKVDADHRFLFHYFKSLKIEAAGYSRHFRFLKRSKIYLPPLIEQKRIATIFDKIDDVLNLRQQAIVKLDALTQNIFLSMFGSTKNNPKNFPVKKLKEIIKFEGGSQPPKSNFSDQQSKENIRLVQIRDFRTDKFKTYIPKNLAKRFFKKDDVMIGRYGPPVFQIFRGLSGSYNVALMKATPCDLVTKDFLYYLLREHDLHSYVVANSERTAGQSGVNLDLLENYLAYLPPIKEQEKFSHAISAYQSLKEKNIKSNKIIKNTLLSFQSQSFGLN